MGIKPLGTRHMSDGVKTIGMFCVRLYYIKTNACVRQIEYVCLLFAPTPTWICVLNVHFQLIHILPFTCSNYLNSMKKVKCMTFDVIYFL